MAVSAGFGGTQRSRWRSIGWLLLLLAAGFLGLVLFRVGPSPSLSIDADLPGIGPRTEITVRARAGGRGLGPIRVELEQEGQVSLLFEREHRPRAAWAFWGPRQVEDLIEVEVGSQSVEGLREGEAIVRVVAERPAALIRRPSPAVLERRMPVKLRPPTIQVTSSLHYVAQGGCEAVVYRLGEGAVRHGVRVASAWFPGFPLPGGDPDEHFALFAVPFDVDDGGEVKLETADELGNTMQQPFLDRFTPRPIRTGRIELSTDFMERVVPPILAQSAGLISEQGDLLASYLVINGELRRLNAERLIELAAESHSGFLWDGPFLQLPNSQVMSPFAVRRTYVFEGEEVDEQVHLGFDLASRRHAPVPASNRGIVVMAEYFGIYGNTVVVDHGYGLMSLYAHLSRIGVEPGQSLDRGEILGETGATGLAGGDHLHFSMLLHGEPVTPMEWWDGKWIRDRIERKIAR